MIRSRHAVLCLVCLVVALMAAEAAWHAALAQNPFGGPRPPAEPPPTGLIGWLLARQAEFYRAMSGAIRAAKSDGRAVWSLLGIAFAYGVFHAAGPGHGKAVISSYLVANEETLRRGVTLSFASAMIQAMVAVGVVAVGAWLLQATAATMCSTERMIEIVSYGLIAAFGARLLWSKGTALLAALRVVRPAPTPVLASAGAPSHALLQVDEERPDGPAPAPAAQSHAHHGHVCDDHCGHAHAAPPEQLAGPGGWQRGLGAILAVGLRPCSGAILLLVFALAQGLFWTGVAATFVMGLGTALTVAAIATVAVSAKGLARRLADRQNGRGILVMRGIETAAAAAVLLVGVGLLLGYVAAERVTCF